MTDAATADKVHRSILRTRRLCKQGPELQLPPNRRGWRRCRARLIPLVKLPQELVELGGSIVMNHHGLPSLQEPIKDPCLCSKPSETSGLSRFFLATSRGPLATSSTYLPAASSKTTIHETSAV